MLPARPSPAAATGRVIAPGTTVVIVSAVGHDGATTVAGVASTPDRATAWLRGPTGRRFVAEYGDADALRDPPERFMATVRVDDLDRHLRVFDSDL